MDHYTPPELSEVCTPLIVGAWSELLRDHTDRAFVRYVINGLTDGFRIGFSRNSPTGHL